MLKVTVLTTTEETAIVAARRWAAPVVAAVNVDDEYQVLTAVSDGLQYIPTFGDGESAVRYLLAVDAAEGMTPAALTLPWDAVFSMVTDGRFAGVAIVDAGRICPVLLDTLCRALQAN